MIDISAYLDNGNIVILDGGIASELQQRGFELDEAAWSSPANITAPDLVREVHQDYIFAGVNIITTNTYSAAKHVLKAAGYENEFEKINSQAVMLAREARDRAERDDIWIAGSISTIPPLNKTGDIRVDSKMESDFRHQAEILAATGVDILILEMMLDSEEALTVTRACNEVDLPLWVGMSADIVPDSETVTALRPSCKFKELGIQKLEDLIVSMSKTRASVLGVMHTKMQVMAPALELLANNWAGPKSAYAEIRQVASSDWIFDTEITPDEYARQALKWHTDFGVQILGGCCGTRPAHIKALADACTK